jgi:hypothetical protein
MILNDSHVKTIADKGRQLPDSVLAPLVISAVLGMAADEQRATAEAVEAPAPKNRKIRNGRAKSTRHVDAVVAYVSSSPGSGISTIIRHVNYSATYIKMGIAMAIQDGRLERRGEGRSTLYYPIQPTDSAEAPPAVLLTEQRIDGENKQRLVRVERRRGVSVNDVPRTAQQRKIAIVEYTNKRPGASLSELARVLRCDKSHAQYAIGLARQDGQIRMDGELGKAKYYPRGYVNGAIASQATTGSA